MRIALITLMGLWSVVGAAAAPNANKHMGVSSCAAGHCHGRIDKDPTSNVWLNEYRICAVTTTIPGRTRRSKRPSPD